MRLVGVDSMLFLIYLLPTYYLTHPIPIANQLMLIIPIMTILIIITNNSAFKFLPILGSRIADSFEGVASAAQKQKWAWPAAKASISRGDGSRGGPARRVLKGEERAML